MLKIAEIGQRVSVARTFNGKYTGAEAAKVVSFDGDGKTHGTITVQLKGGHLETVHASTVNVWPASEKFPRFRKVSAASVVRHAVGLKF